MKIYPTISDERLKEGFTPENDIFQLKPIAEGMTNIVSTIENSLVIAFDGQWGSGKTTFLKMWKAHLEGNGFPVVYFDAFENDYVQDAFAALAREIVALAESSKPLQEKIGEKIGEKAKELGKVLAKGALKVGARAAVRVVTAGAVTAQDLGESFKEAQQELDEILDQQIGQIIGDSKKQKDIVNAFKQALSDLPQQLKPPAENEQQKPLVFIVDELDRCKPLFALELLERIKHFMAVSNVHFVLGVHVGQLQNSVRAAYGSEIDASGYLQKFVNLTILHNDQPDQHGHYRISRYLKVLREQTNLRQEDKEPFGAALSFVELLALANRNSLRTVEQVVANVTLAISYSRGNQLRLGPLIGGLCYLKICHPVKYVAIKQKALSFRELQSIFRISPKTPNANNYNFDWAMNWWEYCLADDPLRDELKDFGRSLGGYYIRDRKDLVPWTASNIVDCLTAG